MTTQFYRSIFISNVAINVTGLQITQTSTRKRGKIKIMVKSDQNYPVLFARSTGHPVVFGLFCSLSGTLHSEGSQQLEQGWLPVLDL